MKIKLNGQSAVCSPSRTFHQKSLHLHLREELLTFIFLHQGMFENRRVLYIFSYIYIFICLSFDISGTTPSASLFCACSEAWTFLSDERRRCWCQSLCPGRREAGYVECVSCFFPLGGALSGAQGSQHICSES